MKILEMRKLGENTLYTLEEKGNLLVKCIKDFNILNSMFIKHKDFVKNSTSFEDSFVYLLDLEEIQTMRIDEEKFLNKNVLSINETVDRRIDMFVLAFESLHELVSDYIADFQPLSKGDLNRLEFYLKASLGQLSCYIYYELGLKSYETNDTMPSESEKLDVVDFIESNFHYDDNDITELANKLSSVVLECNPSMGVFEKYPELLEPFSELVGEDLYDCIDLDLKTVMDVIEGKMPIADFNEKLREIRLKEEKAFRDSLKLKR